MTSPSDISSPRVLLVDDDPDIRTTVQALLEFKGMTVVPASTVTEALRLISAQVFDVLVTDLHMPKAGDGFTVISAMRHSHPQALTLLLSGYPDVKSAMSAIEMEADEILVKPIKVGVLHDRIVAGLGGRKTAIQTMKERVGDTLSRTSLLIMKDWLVRAKASAELREPALTDAERTGHLPKLLEDLVARLRLSGSTGKDSEAHASPAATAHGALRFTQGYKPAMLVQESRLLQVIIFGTLQENLGYLDFSLILPDVMTIADEVDSQLSQSMAAFTKAAETIAQ